MFVAVAGKLAGFLGVADPLKESAADAIRALSPDDAAHETAPNARRRTSGDTPSAFAAPISMRLNAAAGAVIERSRAQGVAIGTGGQLRLDYVPGTADVQVGDTVVTSGIDGIYPKGFVIGQIQSLERGQGAFGAIVVRPAVEFSSLEAVLIVLTTPAPPEEGDASVEGGGAPARP